jgi:hypothetical protein
VTTPVAVEGGVEGARDEHAHVVGAVLVDPARAVEPQHLPGRGGGDHHIADVVDRGDQTRQLDDVGPVAIEDQDGPGVVECAAELYDLPTRSEE